MPNDFTGLPMAAETLEARVATLELNGPGDGPGGTGPAGPGVPQGGGTGQMLAKASGTDYDTQWVNPPAGGGSGGSAPTTTIPSYADIGTVETRFAWAKARYTKPVDLEQTDWEPTDTGYKATFDPPVRLKAKETVDFTDAVFTGGFGLVIPSGARDIYMGLAEDQLSGAHIAVVFAAPHSSDDPMNAIQYGFVYADQSAPDTDLGIPVIEGWAKVEMHAGQPTGNMIPITANEVLSVVVSTVYAENETDALSRIFTAESTASKAPGMYYNANEILPSENGWIRLGPGSQKRFIVDGADFTYEQPEIDLDFMVNLLETGHAELTIEFANPIGPLDEVELYWAFPPDLFIDLGLSPPDPPPDPNDQNDLWSSLLEISFARVRFAPRDINKAFIKPVVETFSTGMPDLLMFLLSMEYVVNVEWEDEYHVKIYGDLPLDGGVDLGGDLLVGNGMGFLITVIIALMLSTGYCPAGYLTEVMN